MHCRSWGNMNAYFGEPFRFRTIWISDVHLGTRRAQAEMLLEFLRVTESETLYVVGDLIDSWALSRTWYWDQSHNDVIQKLLRKARKGTRVIYIPGNHDENFRYFPQFAIWPGLGGQRLHPCDGDRRALSRAAWRQVRRHRQICPVAALLGDTAYEWAMVVNLHLNNVRRFRSCPIGRCRPISSGGSRGRWNSSRISRRRCPRGAGARRDRRGMRPHPLARHSQDRRYPLSQRWRLGRKLHGAGRASRRSF